MQHGAGFMQGFPPPAEKIIRFHDHSYYRYPQLKWSFSNLQQLLPTKTAWRGAGAATPLRSRDLGMEGLVFDSADGETLSWAEAHARTETDAIGVLCRGALVAEAYFGEMAPQKRHAIHSATKSIAGLMAERMIDQGELDEAAPIPTYLPELAGSAWGGATLRHLLDMQIDMAFSEDYLDPGSDVWQMLRAAGQVPPLPGQRVIGVTDLLPAIKSAGPGGRAFAYREPNIFVLTWLLCRVSGMHLNDHFSTRIWQHAGAEQDVLYLLDPNGFCTSALFTLRDFLRLGEMVRSGGDGVFSDRVRAAIFRGGDPAKFAHPGYEGRPGWSYRSQFWMRQHQGRMIAMMRGAHGQILAIDPERELVIARFGSTESARGNLHDHILMPLFDAITDAVAG
ncbi:serine hydrolase [uncultured Paracoccus sp.]|uniref:serine hydrolase domain-containing protein n=1 Tax=uncultured Paracoccus sp. TaxID=189685 RepID=UPI0026249F5A|nr:serine hydrolase [uncultured Paracoccus sp.]